MITANPNPLLNAWSQAGHHLPKARQQLLRQLKQQLQLSRLRFWRQRPPIATMSCAPRPLSAPFVRWGTTACNDPLFQVAPPPAPSPKRPSPALRTIQVIARGDCMQPLMHLRLSGRLGDVCDELDRLAALEGQH